MERRPALLTTLSDLVFPEKRDGAIERLVSEYYLSREAGAHLKHELTETIYNDRNLGPHLAAIKTELDRFISHHRYCPLNPGRLLEHIHARVALSPTHFQYENYAGSTVVDFGAGRYDPFGQAVIHIANGADRVICTEPAPIRAETAHRGALEAAKGILEKPSRFNFSGTPVIEMKRRLVEIDFDKIHRVEKRKPGEVLDVGPIKLCDSLDDLDLISQVDILYSVSVLEHVQGLEGVVDLQTRCLKQDGVMIHLVDFTDHRMRLPEYHPFKFYYDEGLGDINGLRASEVRSLFSNNGLDIEESRIVKLHPAKLEEERIIERFRKYSQDDLLTRTVTYTLQKSA